jgi:glycosyltransferase involved in cell wall biosynthesis
MKKKVLFSSEKKLLFYSKKKLLFYSPVSLYSGGGAERWHCDITNALKNQGISVEIVTGNLSEGRWNKKRLQDNLESIPFTELPYKQLLGMLVPTPSVLITLYKKFKDSDYIHFIYGFMGQDIIVMLLKFLTRKKVIVGHHAPIFHKSLVHNLYMKFISRFMMGFFDYHMTLNKKDKDFFEKQWGINNVFFIPSGVRVEKYLKLKRKSKKGVQFLTVGRLSDQKGTDLVLPAIEKFNAKYPKNDFRFVFVGSGIYDSLATEYAKRNKNIDFKGFIDDSILIKLYQTSDIFLLPSREEPFGLVLIEAWASGLPILATKTEGPLDMLKNEKNGWFIKEISSDGIFKSLEDMKERYDKDHNFPSKLEIASRQSGREYSIENTAKKMIANFIK